jgi:protein phosphatase
MEYLIDNISYKITLIIFISFIIIQFYQRNSSIREKNLLSGANSKGENKINLNLCKQKVTGNGTDLFKLKKSQDICLSAEGFTDCGIVRKNNEDSFVIIGESTGDDTDTSPMLCAVADGMGGKDCGEVASSIAVDILQNEFYQLKNQTGDPLVWKEWLQKTILKAQQAISKKSKDLKIKGTIGTTLVAAVIAGEKAVVANVGDSRAYLLRNDDLQQITKDHSLVSLLVEKELIEPSEIYTHPRRNEIMRFLGQSAELEVDIFETDLVEGDILMFCTDGLWEMVRDPKMKDILKGGSSLSETCAKLIDAANNAGGKDNITVVIVKVE